MLEAPLIKYIYCIGGIYLNNIFINKQLFAAYLGMIVSGYSLMDTQDSLVRDICARLSEIDFGKQVHEYFSYAKTNQTAVNPWYPRGSDMAVACFFSDQSELLSFLRFCDSPSIEDPDFIAWISQLPSVLNKIFSHEKFEAIWDMYRTELQNRYKALPLGISKLQEQLNHLPFGKDIRILFAPNLLQAKYLADYALAGNTLYIISGNYIVTAVKHEYLHVVLHEYRPIILDILRHHSIDEFVVPGKMLSLGYMRDSSPESKAHALEDCIVRALCGVLDSDVDQKTYVRMNQDNGFISVPNMIHNLQSLSLYEMTPEEIIRKMIG